MNQPSTIIVCRDGDGRTDRREFEDALLERLADHGRRSVLVVPHPYYLTADHEAAKRLAAVDGPPVVAAWLHPRATQWILNALGCNGDALAEAVDLRSFESPEACAEALADLAGGAADSAGGRFEEIGGAVAPRWYPVIDYSLCTSCGQCRDFCLFGVYSVEDGGGKVWPSKPENCKPGCPACSRVCPTAAIIFPHYEADCAIAGGDGVIGEGSGRPPAAAVASPEAIDTALKERARCAGCCSSVEGDAQSACLPGQTCDCDCDCDSSEDCCPDGTSQPCDCNCAAPGDELDDLIDDLDRLDDS